MRSSARLPSRWRQAMQVRCGMGRGRKPLPVSDTGILR
jgi:hypothetical protein